MSHMKILILGSGGREHALAWRLKQDPRVEGIWVAPGNPGMPGICVNLDICNPSEVIPFVQEQNIDLTVVGPEAPLFKGIVDVFRKKNLPIFGPCQQAARIEASKIFAKELMQSLGIPTADSKVMGNFDMALEYVEEIGGHCVVKAPGPALGKGAHVCRSVDAAREALEAILLRKEFGEEPALIEELLTGPEASFYVMTDGTNLLPLPAAQDHKAIFEGEKGPMTGGMGAYAPTPVLSEQQYDEVIQDIVLPLFHGLKLKDITYTGVLFVGLMLTPTGPKVIEFNCRFGDPETQALMMLWEEGLLDTLLACSGIGNFENLEKKVKFYKGSASCVVMASEGYPASSSKGQVISGWDEMPEETVLFQAGTCLNEQGQLLTHGGRVLAVAGRAATLQEATDRAYRGIGSISFEGAQYRKDIGHQVL
jgi:phosphoribosylamine--glycine ligase